MLSPNIEAIPSTTTILLDGTENFVVKENGRLTENVKKIGKPEVTTVYNGDNIQDLDSKKLNRLKQNEVYYDGKGNTYVQINAGETAQIMADRINKKRAAGQPQVTAQQIIELNPNLVKKNGEFVLQKFPYTYRQTNFANTFDYNTANNYMFLINPSDKLRLHF